MMNEPFSAKLLAGGIHYGDVLWDSDERTLVWHESHSGHGQIMARDIESASSWRITVPEHNVRAEIGYGGGDFSVAHGVVYFAVKGNGTVFKQALRESSALKLLETEGRAAAFCVDPTNTLLK